MAKARKMVGLNIEETSGVDHPAHLQEGWLVIKSENSGVDDLLSDLQANQEPDASLLTEETMPQDEKVELAAHTPEEDKTKGTGMSYGDMEDKIKQLTDELEKTKAKIMEAINANSTSVNNSPRGTFDATYVATSQAKIDGLIRVETMRSTSQKSIASDELRLSTMKLQFAIESAESDRASRGVIQTEINITSLLNTDPTGGTARLMISLVAERAAATNAHPAPAALSTNIAAFALSLNPVPAPVPVALVVNREIITLNSESHSNARV